ncbi:hypothetical protein EYF80_018691 [Liparis tanakae]|uniref:Uncharacterized protein n=1 Tax=Liparis tanakae TaxID=230148 RepID=A0A4Z2HZQ3_9TELE|nr:hypothetical protein EYF80_018691 [Liparis tanakae]
MTFTWASPPSHLPLTTSLGPHSLHLGLTSFSPAAHPLPFVLAARLSIETGNDALHTFAILPNSSSACVSFWLMTVGGVQNKSIPASASFQKNWPWRLVGREISVEGLATDHADSGVRASAAAGTCLTL